MINLYSAVRLEGTSSSVDLRRGIESPVERVGEELSKLAREVETKEQIAATASISAGDTAIGEMIAEAMDKVSKEGVITVEESNTFGLELELTEGMRFGKGYITAYLLTGPERPEALLSLVNETVLPLPWEMIARRARRAASKRSGTRICAGRAFIAIQRYRWRSGWSET